MNRLWQSTLTELVRAVRSRRALVIVVLYLAMSLLGMNGSISIMGSLERQISSALQLPENKGKSGVVSATVWQSRQFREGVKHMIGDSLIYEDLQGHHPVELLYAFLAFMSVPLLTIMIAANRVADDLRSGAVRYMITRVTRLEWSLGKYCGIALLMLISLLIGGLAAWGIALFRLGGADVGELLFGILGWSLKAWALSLAWLGIALGVSHFFHSGSKATSIAVLVMTVFAIVPQILTALAKYSGGVWIHLEPLVRLFPSSLTDGLWRTSFLPVATSVIWLLMLGLLYFLLGYAFFARRDAR